MAYNWWGAYTLERRPRRKETKPRDSQRQKMYDWQSSHVAAKYPESTKRMTLAECTALVNEIFDAHGFSRPDIRYAHHRKMKAAHWWTENPKTGRPEIFFTNYGLNLKTTLHEVAHGLAEKYTSDKDEPGHGPTFMRVFIDLLVQYAGLDLTDLLQTARMCRLKIAPKPKYKAYVHNYEPTPVTHAIAATEKYKKKTMIVNGGKWIWTIPT